MASFDKIWQLLEQHGALPNKKAECERIWNTFSLEKQRDIYRAINNKIQTGKFVHYNPVLAILENAKASQSAQEGPTFLHGKPLFDALNAHIPLVQVDIPDRPEGRYPVCTREDAERFNLTIIKNF